MNKDKRKNKKELRRKNKERNRREEDNKERNKRKQWNKISHSIRKEKGFYGNTGSLEEVLLTHKVQNDVVREIKDWMEVEEIEEGWFHGTNKDTGKWEQDYSPYKLSFETEERKNEQEGEDK